MIFLPGQSRRSKIRIIGFPAELVPEQSGILESNCARNFRGCGNWSCGKENFERNNIKNEGNSLRLSIIVIFMIITKMIIGSGWGEVDQNKDRRDGRRAYLVEWWRNWKKMISDRTR